MPSADETALTQTVPDQASLDHDLLDRARHLADEVLFPVAEDIDRRRELPRAHLDLLASEGLYGLVGPPDLGGAGASWDTRLAFSEILAGGCLNTTFVWTQHQGALQGALDATGPVHDEWAGPLSSGAAKGGVAFAHLLRPDPVITAERVTDGWLVSGVAPWVTGWGYIDVFLNAARIETDRPDGGDIVWALIDATESPTMTAHPLRLAALDASGTFRIELDRHFVPDERVTSIQSFAGWRADYPKGLRLNGSLGLGVAGRCARLLGPTTFDGELADVRSFLDTATVDELPRARGELGSLTVRMAAAVIATIGGKAIISDHPGQRLAREALFLLIQGQTPEIREHQLAGLV